MKYNQNDVYEKVLYDLDADLTKWFMENKFERVHLDSEKYPYKNLFSSIVINNTLIPNRIVMGPMGNISMADENGRPSEKMIKYFEERAKGGVGLITTGLVPVSLGIDPTVGEKDNLTYFPRIGRSRTNLAGWRDLTYACHNFGSKIFIQLTPGLGRVGNPECLVNMLKFPVSASNNPNFYIPGVPCLRLSGAKIKKIIKRTGQAAADAMACNMDGVYLHGHEGYLMEQLTNSAFNRRKFGRYSNPEAFGLDMVREIRERCGKKFPIYYRIDLSLALNATYKSKMNKKPLKKFKNERTIHETLEYMKHLVEAGVDMFDVDIGCYYNWWLPHPPTSMPSGVYRNIAKIAKDFFKNNNIKTNAGRDVVIVAVGKLGYPDLAESVLESGEADMIMLARPLLADPNWANKARQGRVGEIRPCIGCHEGCIKEFVDGGHPGCAVNPVTGFEEQQKPLTSLDGKKYAVIGAGPAGVTAADVLISRGAVVDLYEKEDYVGGTLECASIPRFKYELQNYVDYLVTRVAEMKTTGRLNLFFNTTANAEMLTSKHYDGIIVAVGAERTPLVFEGGNQKHVVTGVDLLARPELADNAKNVVVVGGGESGAEIAYFLAAEMNKKVTIVEVSPYVMASSCTANRGHILHELEKLGVVIMNMSSVKKVLSDTVIVHANKHKSVPCPYTTNIPVLPFNIKNPLAKKIKEDYRDIEIDADLVVNHTLSLPQSRLYLDLIEKNAAPLIYNVGDSFKPGKVFTAVKSAYNVAINI